MKNLFAFENSMDRTRTLLGWIYLPLHMFVLPLLLSSLSAFSSIALSEVDANLIYYAIGLVFTLTVMLPFLRSGFDRFADAPGRCLFSMVLGLALVYLLSNIVALLLLLLPTLESNPNNEEVLTLLERDYGKIMAISVFVAPIVEEMLFRGVVFGSIRGRSRGLAYVASVLLFSFYHVWQAALVYADPKMLLYFIQYIPVSVALARIYERSGSIWTSIFFHMGYNALSFSVLNLL